MYNLFVLSIADIPGSPRWTLISGLSDCCDPTPSEFLLCLILCLNSSNVSSSLPFTPPLPSPVQPPFPTQLLIQLGLLVQHSASLYLDTRE